MKTVRKLWNLFPLLMLWAMLGIFFWSWIFTFLTDTAPEKKITFYADCEVVNASELCAILEEAAFPGIEMVKFHPFDYALMNSEGIRNADIYIAPASFLHEHEGWARPLPEGFYGGETLSDENGAAMGVCVYSPEADSVFAQGFLLPPAANREAFYLFFGANSPHVLQNENAADDAARVYALKFLSDFIQN